jgi:hypothetical protein
MASPSITAPFETLGLRFPHGPLLRAIDDLRPAEVRREQALRLAHARVVTAHYAVIQHDFPALREDSLLRLRPELARMRGPERTASIHQLIDQWLLRNAALISERQAEQSRVNTPIAHTGERVSVYRPPLYGRALVAQTDAPIPGTDVRVKGLLDLKGAGVAPHREPTHLHHSNGLLDLGDALTDLVFQEIIDAIFQRAAPGFWTVPVYAVLDLGFDIIRSDGQHIPAGMQVRRAHRRPLHGDLPLPGTQAERVRLEIEMLLRSYGISSCIDGSALRLEEREGRLRVFHSRQELRLTAEQLRAVRRMTRFKSEPLYFDGINVQLAEGARARPSYAQVVDFGHYAARADFRHPVVNLVRGRLLRWGSVLWPDSPYFIHPDPRLALPSELHGYVHPDACAPGAPPLRLPLEQEQPGARVLVMIRQLRQGTLSRAALEAELRGFVALATRRW